MQVCASSRVPTRKAAGPKNRGGAYVPPFFGGMYAPSRKGRRVEKSSAKNDLVLKTKGIGRIGPSTSLWPFFMSFRGRKAHGDRHAELRHVCATPNFHQASRAEGPKGQTSENTRSALPALTFSGSESAWIEAHPGRSLTDAGKPGVMRERVGQPPGGRPDSPGGTSACRSSKCRGCGPLGR